MALFSYDPEFERWFCAEQKRFQREFQRESFTRGTTHKIRVRWVRAKGGAGGRVALWYVFRCDVTRDGRDARLATPELAGGPFAFHEEAEAFVAELKAGRRVFYFGGRNFDLTAPRDAAKLQEERAEKLRESLGE